MEREQLVGTRFGDQWAIGMCLRWRCWTTASMWGALSRRWAALRPAELPNGMGVVGRHSGQEWEVFFLMCVVWRRWAVICMQEVASRRRAPKLRHTLPGL